MLQVLVGDQALGRELEAVILEAKSKAAKIREPSGLWELEQYLTQCRQEIDRKYDYRYSVLPLVLAFAPDVILSNTTPVTAAPGVIPRSRGPMARQRPGLSALAAREQLKEEQEHVEDVKEDRRGHERR